MLISLKTDYVFKELFAHENVRKQFLSDVLDIPLEEMKSVRIMNPFLRRRFRRQKEGILDMALEMVGGAKVNIELQVGELGQAEAVLPGQAVHGGSVRRAEL